MTEKTEKQIKTKAYNQIYYEKNKDKLIGHLCEKVECVLCGKFVTRNRLNLHKDAAICKRLRERKFKDKEILKQLQNAESII